MKVIIIRNIYLILWKNQLKNSIRMYYVLKRWGA